MKKCRVWLVNQYAMPPKYESRLRTIKFAQYLKEQGYEVTIFSSSFLHNTDINLIKGIKLYEKHTYDDIDFIHIKTMSYRNNGLKRILSSFEFSCKLHFFCQKFESPDIIINTALVPFSNLIYYTAKRVKSKLVVEILDLWPESFVAFGVIKKNNLLLKLAYFAEKWLYTKADAIVFSMEGGEEYIKRKKWDISSGGTISLNKVFHINNGVDLLDFQYNLEHYSLEDKDLEDNDIFKVIYLGSIRLANGIQNLIEAANNIKKYPNIKFLIYGNGDDREHLENLVIEKRISNVVFKEKWISPQYVPYVLSHASLNILNYKPNNVDHYGGSQSKFFQYLASGKPICANIDMKQYCIITRYKLGTAREYSSSREYAEAILNFYNMPMLEYSQMCLRVKKTAKLYDYRRLTLAMKNIIELINI